MPNEDALHDVAAGLLFAMSAIILVAMAIVAWHSRRRR
jgi:hypothetical protein